MGQSDTVMDEAIGEAVEPYRQVVASSRLREAVLGTDLVPTAGSTRRARLGFAGLVVAAAAAAAAVLVGVVQDDIDAPPSGGDTAAVALGLMETIVFSDGSTVSADVLFDSANHDQLEVLFEQHGATLEIQERSVAADAHGRVFSVTVDEAMTDDADPSVVHLRPGGQVQVVVGRADDREGVAGLTLYEVFPAIEGAFDREDPVGTGEALQQLGFRPLWVLITAPGQSEGVDAPPAGTVVISVLGPNGEWTDIDPTIDSLMVEIASPEVAAELGD